MHDLLGFPGATRKYDERKPTTAIYVHTKFKTLSYVCVYILVADTLRSCDDDDLMIVFLLAKVRPSFSIKYLFNV